MNSLVICYSKEPRRLCILVRSLSILFGNLRKQVFLAFSRVGSSSRHHSIFIVFHQISFYIFYIFYCIIEFYTDNISHSSTIPCPSSYFYQHKLHNLFLWSSIQECQCLYATDSGQDPQGKVQEPCRVNLPLASDGHRLKAPGIGQAKLF